MKEILLAVREFGRTHPIPPDQPPQFAFWTCNGATCVIVNREGRERAYKINTSLAESLRARMNPHPTLAGWYVPSRPGR